MRHERRPPTTPVIEMVLTAILVGVILNTSTGARGIGHTAGIRSVWR